MVAKVEPLGCVAKCLLYPLNEALEAEIARLPDLGLAELRARWLKLYGTPAPKFFRRELLVRAVAYQMQVKAYGGLSAATKRRLREIAEVVRNGNEDDLVLCAKDQAGHATAQGVARRDPPGHRAAGWLRVEGTKYRSLSAIAREITGTNWNGYAFFGLKRRTRKKPPPVLEHDHA